MEKDKEIARLAKALAEETKKAAETEKVKNLEIKSAVMEAKMKFGVRESLPRPTHRSWSSS